MSKEKIVILVGLNEETSSRVYDYLGKYPDAEVWTINRGERMGFVPKCDALLEMHPKEMIESPNFDAVHREWLHQSHPFPIFMLEQNTDLYPSSFEYPKDDVLALCDTGLETMSGEPIHYFTSSLDWMIGLAVYLGFDRICICGFEMGTQTEYAYQKAGAEALMRMAAAMGVKVILPDERMLLKAKLYGYEGSQMITRQQLEYYRAHYMQDIQSQIGELNRLVTLRDKADGDHAKFIELDEKVTQQMYLVQREQGALALAEKLIAECDLQEPDMELRDRMMFTVSENQ